MKFNTGTTAFDEAIFTLLRHRGQTTELAIASAIAEPWAPVYAALLRLKLRGLISNPAGSDLWATA